jgi:hypothetical protein
MGMIDYSWRWQRRRCRESRQEQGMSHRIDRILVLHPQPARANGLSSCRRLAQADPMRVAATGENHSSTYTHSHILINRIELNRIESPTLTLLHICNSKRDISAVASKAGNDWRVASSIQELSRQD